jgi:hypothetical protein
MAENKREPKPSIVWGELLASTSERPIHPRIHEPLMRAIKNKNVVSLKLRSWVESVGEPHVYGMRGGRPTLLVYNDKADPPWQFVDVRDIDQVNVWPNEHFEKRELPGEFDPDRDTH